MIEEEDTFVSYTGRRLRRGVPKNSCNGNVYTTLYIQTLLGYRMKNSWSVTSSGLYSISIMNSSAQYRSSAFLEFYSSSRAENFIILWSPCTISLTRCMFPPLRGSGLMSRAPSEPAKIYILMFVILTHRFASYRRVGSYSSSRSMLQLF